MFHEILDFLFKAFVEWPADRVAALVIGLFVGVALLLYLSLKLAWLSMPGKMRGLQGEKESLEHQVREEQGKNASLHQVLQNVEERHRRECTHLNERLEAEREKSRGLSAEAERWHAEALRHEEAAAALAAYLKKVKHAGRHFVGKWRDSERRRLASEERVRNILAQEGKFWERPPGEGLPPFRPMKKGAAAIVAVMNLKGGVGKSTLTANLGFTLARSGLRVLLIDLDHQATLTRLCLTIPQIEDTQKGEGRLVNNLFKADRSLDEVVWRNLVPLPAAPGGHLLAVSPDFLQVEEMVKTRWLLHPGGRDHRYLMREALHAPLLQERFDLILIDCPPRPTTSCVNALACADQVLIPTLADPASAAAVPLMLGWMRVLKERGVCPDLKILGVIANRVYAVNRFVSRELAVWTELQTLCREQWQQPVYHFRRTMPNKAAFADAARKQAPAAFEPELEPIFRELAEEMLSRKVIHERRKSANTAP